jgi:hypothetical protein
MPRPCAACQYWDIAGLDGALNSGMSYANVARCVGLTKRQIEGHAKHKSCATGVWSYSEGCCLACGAPVDEKTAHSIEGEFEDGSKTTILAHPFAACVTTAGFKMGTLAFQDQFIKGRGRSPRPEWEQIIRERDRKRPAPPPGTGLLDDGERMDRVTAYCRETGSPLWLADLMEVESKILTEASRKSPEHLAAAIEAVAPPRERSRRQVHALAALRAAPRYRRPKPR